MKYGYRVIKVPRMHQGNVAIWIVASPATQKSGILGHPLDAFSNRMIVIRSIYSATLSPLNRNTSSIVYPDDRSCGWSEAVSPHR